MGASKSLWRLPSLLGVAFVAGCDLAFWHYRIVSTARLPGAITGWNGDLYTAYYPVFHYAYRSEQFLPTWNPYQLAGTPFWGNANGIFYPPNFVARFLPVGLSLGILSALHLAFAGGATFVAMRTLSLSVAAAVLAGVIFMLNGLFVSSFIHPSHLFGYAWVPVLFLAGGRLVAAPSIGTAAALGFALALQLLTGSSQMTLYSGYALLAAGVTYVAIVPERGRAHLLRLGTFGVLSIIVALLLAAVQIAPTIEVLRHAARGGIPVKETLPNSADVRFVHSVLLAGGPAAILSAVGIFDNSRRGIVVAAAAVLIFALLFGLGTPVYAHLLYYLPGVDRFRVPNRMLIAGNFAFAALTGFGLDVLREPRSWSRRAGSLLLLAVLVAAVSVLGILGLCLSSGVKVA
jgi:hypothetical protein